MQGGAVSATALLMIGLHRLAELTAIDPPPSEGPLDPVPPDARVLSWRAAAGAEAVRALRAGLRLTDPALAGTHAVALTQALLALGRGVFCAVAAAARPMIPLPAACRLPAPFRRAAPTAP